MKSFIVLALFVAVAVAAPASPDSDAQTLLQSGDIYPEGSYKNIFETSNGIKQEEQGQLVNPGTENEGIEVQGRFSYVGTDGVTYVVEYTAGAEGFKPRGAHIPV